jgi:hypothetical protein
VERLATDENAIALTQTLYYLSLKIYIVLLNIKKYIEYCIYSNARTRTMLKKFLLLFLLPITITLIGGVLIYHYTDIIKGEEGLILSSTKM